MFLVSIFVCNLLGARQIECSGLLELADGNSCLQSQKQFQRGPSEPKW